MLRALLATAALLALGAPAHAQTNLAPGAVVDGMTVVAAFPHDRPTAVAVARAGRIFVSLPYAAFSDERHQATVVEVLDGGGTRPYPDEIWNRKEPQAGPSERLLNVQSLTLDAAGFLWVLDTGSPKRAGVVPGGAKLVKVDLATDRVVGVVPIGAPALTRADSYLNDVRVDASRHVAYLTDSVHGGIVVLDLATGSARMTLANPHPPAILAEERRVPVVEGVRLAAPEGGVMSLATDGLALSPDGDTLFVAYRPLAGSRRIYRVATQDLRDEALSPVELARRLQDAGPAVVSDGIEIGPEGAIYYSDLERNAIARARPGEAPEIVVQSPLLRWPDGMAFAPDGSMLVTVAQFHLLAGLNGGQDRSSPPYLLVRTRR